MASAGNGGGGGPADSGWLFPTAYAHFGGDVNWSNPTYVYNDDANHADANLDDFEESSVLMCTGYGFAIPSGATILGVEVMLDRYCSAGDDLYENIEKLITGGTLAGTNKATTSQTLPKSSNDLTLGSSSDLWGLTNGTTITDTIINASNFGFGMGIFEDDRDGNTRGYYNYNKMKVHYST